MATKVEIVNGGELHKNGKLEGIGMLAPLNKTVVDLSASTEQVVAESYASTEQVVANLSASTEQDVADLSANTKSASTGDTEKKEDAVETTAIAINKQVVNFRVRTKTQKYTDKFEKMPADKFVFYNTILSGCICADSAKRPFLLVDGKDGERPFSVPFMSINGQTHLLEKVEETAAYAQSASAARLTEVSTSDPVPDASATMDDAFAQLVDGTIVNAIIGVQSIDSKVIKPNSSNTTRGPQFSSGVKVAGVVNTVRLGNGNDMKEFKGLFTTANEFIPFFTQGGKRVFKSVSVSVDPNVSVVVAGSQVRSDAKSNDSPVKSEVVVKSATKSPVLNVRDSSYIQQLIDALSSEIEAKEVEIENQKAELPKKKDELKQLNEDYKKLNTIVTKAKHTALKTEIMQQAEETLKSIRMAISTLGKEIREIEESLNLVVSNHAAQACGSWSVLVQNSAPALAPVLVPASSHASVPAPSSFSPDFASEIAALCTELMDKYPELTCVPFEDGIVTYQTDRESRGWKHSDDASCKKNQYLGLSCPNCHTVGEKTDGLPFCSFGVNCKNSKCPMNWHFLKGLLGRRWLQ